MTGRWGCAGLQRLFAVFQLWGAGGGTTEAGDAESQPNGANEGRSMPQDLREAISQVPC